MTERERERDRGRVTVMAPIGGRRYEVDEGRTRLNNKVI